MKDTIVAQATPIGRGGVGILRVSGPLAKTVAEAVLGKNYHPVWQIICRLKMKTVRC